MATASVEVLTTAVETGSGYWAKFDRIVRDDQAFVTSVRVIEDGTRIDGGGAFSKFVEGQHIEQAVDAIRSGKVNVSRLIAGQFVGWETDEYEVDAIGADVALQIAVFGEIKYG